MWMKCQKSPEDSSLRHQYILLKAESRRCADEAREKWLEDKVVRAEGLHDEAVKRVHGGSLLKDLRLLQRSQKLNTILYYAIYKGWLTAAQLSLTSYNAAESILNQLVMS